MGLKEAVDAAFGFNPPALEEYSINGAILACQNIGDQKCVDDRPVTMGILCTQPEIPSELTNACTLFNERYTATSIRHALFDAYYKGSTATPFDPLNEKAPLTFQHLVKAHHTFYNTGDAIGQNYPGVIEDRELTVLYLGSGAHLSPLLTAMRLIDEDKIDSAHYTYTEIDPQTTSHIYDALVEAKRYNPQLYDDVKLEGNTITLTYKEKTITVYTSIRHPENAVFDVYGIGSTSVYNYYNENELVRADLVVIHDIYATDGEAVRDLMLHQWKLHHEGDTKQRLVLSEDVYTSAAMPYEYVVLDGPYGCSVLDNEVGDPDFEAATLIDLGQRWILPRGMGFGLQADVRYLEKAEAILNESLNADLDFAVRFAINIVENFKNYQESFERYSSEPDEALQIDFPPLEDVLKGHNQLVDKVNQTLIRAGLLQTGQTFWNALNDERIWALMLTFIQHPHIP